MRLEARHGILVDDGADVGGEVKRIADIERFHRARPACRSSRLATSSCTKNRRAAEQRWPAESKAERTRSRITCSGSALESAIMALMPAGLGDEGHDGAAPRGERLLDRPARLVGAGEGDAGNARILDQGGTDRRRRPAADAAHRPARRPRAAAAVARKAAIGVCSAGLASTGLPAASAAATWPVKIASGKFHGLMQANGPRPRSVQRVGLARRALQRDRRRQTAAAPRLA